MLIRPSFCATYLEVRNGCFPSLGPLPQSGVVVFVCAVWAHVLFGRERLEWWLRGKRSDRGDVVEPSIPTSEPVNPQLVPELTETH